MYKKARKGQLQRQSFQTQSTTPRSLPSGTRLENRTSLSPILQRFQSAWQPACVSDSRHASSQ